MSKCRRCNIDVLDHSLSCPLCNGVLEYDPEKDTESEKDFLDHSQETGEKSKSVMYPDVEPAMRRMRFVIKLTIFCSIVIEGILILINYLTYSKVKWSALCGIGLAYACFSLIYSFRHNISGFIFSLLA